MIMAVSAAPEDEIRELSRESDQRAWQLPPSRKMKSVDVCPKRTSCVGRHAIEPHV